MEIRGASAVTYAKQDADRTTSENCIGSAANAALAPAAAIQHHQQQQGGASRVEVYGFVGWITSAVGFGEWRKQGKLCRVLVARLRL